MSELAKRSVPTGIDYVPLPRRAERAILDYRQPSVAERALTLRAAFDRCDADDNQRLLLRELMDYYRDWCLRNDLGDPFRDD